MGKPRNRFEHATNNLLIEKNVHFEYEGEKIPYVLYGTYMPDFTIHRVHEAPLLRVELKGYLRPGDKRKLLAVKKQHPDIDLRILFYAYNKSNTTWADKNRIPYAVGTLPEEWLDGSENGYRGPPGHTDEQGQDGGTSRPRRRRVSRRRKRKTSNRKSVVKKRSSKGRSQVQRSNATTGLTELV